MALGVAERNADVVRKGTSDASETATAVGKFMSLSALPYDAVVVTDV